MATLFQRVLVVLDALAPDRGAFAWALDWARKCRCSLHALSFLPEQGEAEVIRQCASTCRQQGVVWEHSSCAGGALRGLKPLLQPADLLVFGHALPEALKQTFFQRDAVGAAPTLLVCSTASPAWSRLLVLDMDPQKEGHYWASVVQLCRFLGAAPVVVTVARSEHAARFRQAVAREALAGSELCADFDFMVGSEVRTAVAKIARWRRCQVVLMERSGGRSWWHWLHGDTTKQRMSLAGLLTLLTLPGAGLPVFSLDATRTAPAPVQLFSLDGASWQGVARAEAGLETAAQPVLPEQRGMRRAPSTTLAPPLGKG